MKRFWAYLGASVIGVLLSAWLMPGGIVDFTLGGFPFVFTYRAIDGSDLYFAGFLLDVLIFFGPNALILYRVEKVARRWGVKESVVNGVLRALALVALVLLVLSYASMAFGRREYSGRWEFHLGLR